MLLAFTTLPMQQQQLLQAPSPQTGAPYLSAPRVVSGGPPRCWLQLAAVSGVRL